MNDNVEIIVDPATKAVSFVVALPAAKGGAGSGNFGHAGRPGQRGGSAGASTILNVSTGMHSSSSGAFGGDYGDYEASNVEMTSVARRSNTHFAWIDMDPAGQVPKACMDIWTEEVEQHPAWATANIRQSRVSSVPGEAVFAGSAKLGSTAGSYFLDTSEVVIWNQTDATKARSYVQKGIIDHEIGHSIYEHLTDVHEPMSGGGDKWEQLELRAQATSLKQNFDDAWNKYGDGITEYSRSVAKRTETFAEAYKIYHSGAKPWAAHPGVYSKEAGVDALKSHFKAYPRQAPMLKSFLDILEFCEQRGY